MKISKWKNLGVFAGGVLFGTAGIKVLSSRDAKKAYANCTAAVLRAKDCVVKTVEIVQENAEDVLAEAKHINKVRDEEDAAAVEEDFKECCEEADETEEV